MATSHNAISQSFRKHSHTGTVGMHSAYAGPSNSITLMMMSLDCLAIFSYYVDHTESILKRQGLHYMYRQFMPFSCMHSSWMCGAKDSRKDY